MNLTFLGGTGTVTGSKYLVECAGKTLLVDCGLFQGLKDLRLRNWAPFPIVPRSIDAVILIHAHLDHSGYIPRLVREGFAGPIIATSGTRDLCGILLPDSGHLMELDAEYANRKGFSRHHPAQPLYTRAEAEKTLDKFVCHSFGSNVDLGCGITLRFSPSGHILGSAFVELITDKLKVTFSGDLGRPGSATMVDPVKIAQTDYLLVESTYGDRLHEEGDPEQLLGEIVNKTAKRGGTVIIPSFAVGRAQTMLYHLHRLRDSRRIPNVPIFLDSPMAVNASEIFCNHVEEHRLSVQDCRATCSAATYVRDAEDSKALDRNDMPMVIITASGMATGGRVLHHLKRFAPDPRSTILFVGFQAAGTRGARIVAGENEVKIHGGMVPIRADVANLHTLSAHADSREIIDWLRGFTSSPKTTFVTHGEPKASSALARTIGHDLGWNCAVPRLGSRVTLH